MEAIIRHSPIPRNSPIYRIYGNIPYPVRVYCSCCAKGSKAKSTVPHADPAHRGSGGFCLPVLAARHEHVRFAICTQEKKEGGGDYLSFPPVSLKLKVAALRNLSSKSISWEAV